jgi:crossover junction endodeoxyribonuclease RuvC
MFFGKNITTAITVAQGRGVILLTLMQARLPIHEYKPNFIKQSISGYGSAKKPQMQEMVRILLGLETIPRPDDAADALAIAITDIHNAQYAALDDL